MFYYLKINRNEGYMIRNLRHWIDVVRCDENGEYLIICDKDEVRERAMNSIVGISEDDFITSDRINPDIREITKYNTNEFWNNASYSHLTTFLDAKKRGLECFWNIDADDTCFCAEPSRVFCIMKEACQYAKQMEIHAFSFDMSRSRRKGKFWSFGVTFTDNNVDWFSELLKHAHDDYYDKENYSEYGLPYCIDTYFTYLMGCTELKLATFFVENCKFVHYSNDFVYRPWASWFAIYRNGFIYKPMLEGFYELESLGTVKIFDDVVKLDVGLTSEEQTRWLIDCADENEKNKALLNASIIESQ